MAQSGDLIDIRSGDLFHQPVPYGLVYPTCTADGEAPPSQRGRTWEHLTASGRVLEPLGR